MQGGDQLLGAVLESRHQRDNGARRAEALFLPEAVELEFCLSV